MKKKNLFILALVALLVAGSLTAYAEGSTETPSGSGTPATGGGTSAPSGNSGGTTWTAVSNSTFGIYPIYSIAYGGDRWVAGRESGRIAYSTN